MLIYKCVITDSEFLSDSYPVEVIGNIFFKVKGQRVTKKGGIDDSLIGGNASENPDELTDEATGGDDTEFVTDLIDTYRLRETSYSKKVYQSDLKKYCAAIVAHLEKTDPSRVDGFKKEVGPAMKDLMKQFGDLQFFLGEQDEELKGMVVLSLFGDDGSPYFYYFKDGFKEEKQ